MIRAELDPKKDILQSKVELKMIWLEKIKQEGEIEKRLAGIMARSPQERQMIVSIERTKLMDTIYLKYGLRMSDLTHEVKKHCLENDPDVKALSE